MAIITISRGSKSGGAQLAEMLSERLGAECISREVLMEAAADFGFDEQRLADILSKPPHLWERLTSKRKHYLKFITAKLLDHARSGNLVYHGHAGQFLLKAIPCVLRVKLIAPMEQRVDLLMESMGMTKAEAEDHLKEVDDTRVKWTKLLYGVDWNDPALYDLVINLEKLSLATACEIILDTVEQEPCKVTETCLRTVEDRAAEARIQAALSADRRTATVEISAAVEGDVITLNGTIEASKVRRDILRVIHEAGIEGKIHDELTVRKASPLPT